MKAAEIGIELARLRRAAGLTQADVARRMGTSQSAIARLESSWRASPTVDFIERFARAIGTPVEITFGQTLPEAATAAQRSREALGTYRFDPWRRHPSAAEVRSLTAEGTQSEPRRRRSSTPARDLRA